MVHGWTTTVVNPLFLSNKLRANFAEWEADEAEYLRIIRKYEYRARRRKLEQQVEADRGNASKFLVSETLKFTKRQDFVRVAS